MRGQLKSVGTPECVKVVGEIFFNSLTSQIGCRPVLKVCVIQFCHFLFSQYLLIYHSQLLVVGEVQKYLQFRNLFFKDNLLFDDGIEHQKHSNKQKTCVDF